MGETCDHGGASFYLPHCMSEGALGRASRGKPALEARNERADTDPTLFGQSWRRRVRGLDTSLPESGGWGGIRTHETLARLPVFKSGK